MAKTRNTKFIKLVVERIKEIREKQGITQEVVFYDTGINIGRIERGERDISLSTIKAICEYFEVPVHDLFKGIK